MIYIFTKTCLRAATWAQEKNLREDQYKCFIRPEDFSGLCIRPKDRLVVVGVVSQYMLNAIQACQGKPEGVPQIEFYP